MSEERDGDEKLRDYFLVVELLGVRRSESIQDAVTRIVADKRFGRKRIIAGCLSQARKGPWERIHEAAALARRRGWEKP